MNQRCNSMWFDNVGKAIEFIRVLHNISKEDNEYYNDIHTYQEESSIIVEWTQIPRDHEFGGTFQLVEEDEEVMLCKTFPDNHYEYFHSKEEYDEALKEWLEKNPTWHKEQYEQWINDKE